MKRPIWVERAAVLMLHDESLSAHGGAVGIRDAGLLDSALARPQNRFAYGEADAAALAAAYAFGVIKNHPFIDGNKRTGFLCAALFLELNDFRFSAGEADVVLRTLALAAGEMSEDDYAAWLRENAEG
ncbi:MAG: type II toxin-antitoxin system death-on-curing family toxin [Alphaproteobacteria bacterium]|nr:type II toxin-antitoxin system death-on-curing family toxin [Alphaproteobacteria bacterium]